MRVEPEVQCALRRFEPEQAAADHERSLALLRVRLDRREVVDRAVDEATGQIEPGHRRHERVRAAREHEVVVGLAAPLRGEDDLRVAIDRGDLLVEVEDAAARFVRGLGGQREPVLAGVAEVLAQADAIVGRTRLLADHDEFDVSPSIRFQHAFAEAVADHSVADHDDAPIHPSDSTPSRAAGAEVAPPQRVPKGLQLRGRTRPSAVSRRPRTEAGKFLLGRTSRSVPVRAWSRAVVASSRCGPPPARARAMAHVSVAAANVTVSVDEAAVPPGWADGAARKRGSAAIGAARRQSLKSAALLFAISSRNHAGNWPTNFCTSQ